MPALTIRLGASDIAVGGASAPGGRKSYFPLGSKPGMCSISMYNHFTLSSGNSGPKPCDADMRKKLHAFDGES